MPERSHEQTDELSVKSAPRDPPRLNRPSLSRLHLLAFSLISSRRRSASASNEHGDGCFCDAFTMTSVRHNAHHQDAHRFPAGAPTPALSLSRPSLPTATASNPAFYVASLVSHQSCWNGFHCESSACRGMLTTAACQGSPSTPVDRTTKRCYPPPDRSRGKSA